VSPAAGGLWWRRWPLLTLLLSLAALGVALAPGAGPLLELDRALLVRQPWRLWTGHFVHWSGDHLLWDVLVFVALGAVAERRSRGRCALVLAAGALTIAVAVVLGPAVSVYRGLSGVDSALLGLVLATRLSDPRLRFGAALTLLLFAGKVAFELASSEALFVRGSPGVEVVPLAHVVGLVTGLALGAWPRWGSRPAVRMARCASSAAGCAAVAAPPR
jgi:rhomboid family GlyGly-CTERM serine protease